jgi:hypothetical protein
MHNFFYYRPYKCLVKAYMGCPVYRPTALHGEGGGRGGCYLFRYNKTLYYFIGAAGDHVTFYNSESPPPHRHTGTPLVTDSLKVSFLYCIL